MICGKKTDEKILQVLESDRLSLAGEAVELIKNDLLKVLSEYFSLSSAPDLKIISEKNKYKILIEADCDRLKSFGRV